jgi:hypothetical protein
MHSEDKKLYITGIAQQSLLAGALQGITVDGKITTCMPFCISVSVLYVKYLIPFAKY